MSYVIAAPEALVAAATDLATLGSTIGAANAAAAGSTTALLTAGADEVSAAIAAYSECTARPIRHSVRGRRRSMSGSCRPWPQWGRLCGRRGRQRLAAAERARFAECAHSGAVGASVGGQWRQWGPGDWGKRRRWRDFVRVRGPAGPERPAWRAMYGYAAASASASRLIPFAAPPKTTNSAGVVAQVAAVAAMPGLLQRLSSAASVSWSNPNDWWLVRLLGSITPTERTRIVRLLGQSYFATGMAQFFASIAQQLTFGPGGTTAGSGGAWYPTPQFAGLGASRAVSASLARANKIGALSVPPSWVKTTALTESPVAHAVSANPTVGSSHGPHGLLRGLPLGSRITRRSGAFAHRYGFRHSVVARPPSAG